jgi:hypothetical protein
MKRSFVFLGLALAMAVPWACAQESQTAPQAAAPATAAQGKTATKHKAKPESAAPANPMAKSAAEMQKLKLLAGHWTTATKFEPAEWMPKGGTALGTADLHFATGKLTLLENFKSEMPGMGPFSGHGVLWWDAKGEQYKAFWCDSMEGCVETFEAGKWEGDKLVFTCETEHQGNKVATRETFSDIKPDSFTWTEETATGGGPMKLSMTIQYTRAAATEQKPPEAGPKQ